MALHVLDAQQEAGIFSIQMQRNLLRFLGALPLELPPIPPANSAHLAAIGYVQLLLKGLL